MVLENEQKLTTVGKNRDLPAVGQTFTLPDGSIIAFVDVNQIEVDEDYQRAARENLISSISRDFSERSFGIILLNWRDDGTLFCFDGQNRIKAVRQMNARSRQVGKDSVQHVLARVFIGITPQEEAAEFLRCNEMRGPVPALAKYKALVFRGDPIASTIDRIVKGAGLRIAEIRAENGIHAVEALRYVLQNYNADILRSTLQVLRDAFPDEAKTRYSFDGSLIRGTALFLATYGSRIQLKEFTERLANETLSSIKQYVMDRRKPGGKTDVLYADKLIEVWNYKRQRYNRLPPIAWKS